MRMNPKVSGLSHNEINNNNNNDKHTLRSNIKGYGGKNYYTDSQNSDINAPSWQRTVSFAVLAPGGQSGNLNTPSYI